MQVVRPRPVKAPFLSFRHRWANGLPSMISIVLGIEGEKICGGVDWIRKSLRTHIWQHSSIHFTLSCYHVDCGFERDGGEGYNRELMAAREAIAAAAVSRCNKEEGPIPETEIACGRFGIFCRDVCPPGRQSIHQSTITF